LLLAPERNTALPDFMLRKFDPGGAEFNHLPALTDLARRHPQWCLRRGAIHGLPLIYILPRM